MHLIQPHGIDPIIPSEIIETPAIFSLSFFCAIYLSIAPVLLITCLHFVCFLYEFCCSNIVSPAEPVIRRLPAPPLDSLPHLPPVAPITLQSSSRREIHISRQRGLTQDNTTGKYKLKVHISYSNQ